MVVLKVLVELNPTLETSEKGTREGPARGINAQGILVRVQYIILV
jgi:hypothetical protein